MLNLMSAIYCKFVLDFALFIDRNLTNELTNQQTNTLIK